MGDATSPHYWHHLLVCARLCTSHTIPRRRTCLLTLLQIRYTLGEVVASLAMIESPSTTAIIDQKPPAYADEPDAPLEKEALIPSEATADTDVEVTLIEHKPITTSLRATIKHLHRIGGFRARWRGVGVSVIYHLAHSFVTHLLGAFLGFGLFGNSIAYIISSLALCRVHMAWTHSMIAHPSSKSWFRRVVPRKQSKAVLLPALVFAVAQQATFILPVAVMFALGLHNIDTQDMTNKDGHMCHKKAGIVLLRILPVPATALLVALAVLLPAAVTLTRVEAALLSEEEETIVPFDRQALMGDVDLTQRGGARALFVQAWRSFDRAARLKVLKLYAKMIFIQIVVIVVGLQIMVAEVFVIGAAKLAIFSKSANAQLQLMAIEAHQNQN